MTAAGQRGSTALTRKEYKELLEYDLYRGKKVSFLGRIRLKYFSSQTNFVYLCRKMWYLQSKGSISRFFAKRVSMRILHKYGCWISVSAKVGKGFKVAHPVGIVMGACTAGENFALYQNTTIGAKHVSDLQRTDEQIYPRIGNNVKAFAGSIILGDISICDDTFIGANSLVIKSIEEPGTYVGSPVRKIKENRDEE